jgi:multidrug efflux pump subunit AcrA (membrane-fusion protein)
MVNVTPVRRSSPMTGLLLPGTVTPLTEAYLYARATGYVTKRYADIGDRVRTGQVLADIDAPDLDQQVAQARAALAQSEQQLAQSKAALENAQAQEELARVTWERYRVLVQHGAVSRQDADQQLANYRSQTANVHLQEAAVRTSEENVRANRANLDREIALQSFEKIRAPFNGVITARNFDVGALVSSGGGSAGLSTTPLGGTQASSATGNAGASGANPQAVASSPTAPGIGSTGELFRIAQIGTVRVLVNVPQVNATSIRVGQAASVYILEFSKSVFPGKVTRTSRSLDESARTLVVEVDVSNPDYLLLPGMYAQIQFTDRIFEPPLLVPGDSIMATPDGLEVAVLVDPTPQQRQKLQQEQEKEQEQQRQTKENKSGQLDATRVKRVHIQKIEVGRDYGLETEVTSGLEGWEYVVTNPGDAVEENALVIPQAAPAIAGEGGSQRRSQSDRHPSGIGAPSMAAPTQGAPQQGGGKGDGH